VPGDFEFPIRRTGGKLITNAFRKGLDEFLIERMATFGCLFPQFPALVFITRAFFFGPVHGLLFDEKPLALITFAGTAPLQDDRTQG
jgi:hypothetical protein